MDQREIESLLIRFRLGLCSEDEKQRIELWYEEMYRTSDFKYDEGKQVHLKNEAWEFINVQLDSFSRASGLIKPDKASTRRLWWLAAAAVLCIFSISILLYNRTGINWRDKPLAERYQNDVAPGHLGGSIAMDGENFEELSLPAHSVSKTLTPDGFIQLNNGRSAHAYSIKTSKGQNLKLLLPDGSKIWLNAGSNLALNLPFQKNKRTVYIEGEAYFEVAKDKSRPFMVRSPKSEITVLGTHFNVNTYSSRQEQVTLLEGLVSVQPTTKIKNAIALHPNQKVNIEDQSIQLTEVKDASRDIAWSQGYFSFDNTPIAEVMQQLGIWYNVDIVYQNGVPVDKFYGELNKKSKLSEILRVLEKTGVKFLIQDRTVTVL